MPDGLRAELIGGIVFMPSLLKPRHGRTHAKTMGWLAYFEQATPGVELYDNTTAILGPEDEPQPDAYLIIAPERGGQMRYNAQEYLEGAPEWIGEVALSSEAIDLHRKRDAYERAGVKEYAAVVLRQPRVLWLVNPSGTFQELAPGPDGILRSEVFPGLWLDPEALLRGDSPRVLDVLRQGLATPEHAAFVAKLNLAAQAAPDDFVICCRGTADAAMTVMRTMLAKLKLRACPGPEPLRRAAVACKGSTCARTRERSDDTPMRPPRCSGVSPVTAWESRCVPCIIGPGTRRMISLRRGGPSMVARGYVQNGVVVLADGLRLAEGLEVTVLAPPPPTSKAHGILDIPSISLGSIVRPCSADDDILAEMLEDRP